MRVSQYLADVISDVALGEVGAAHQNIHQIASAGQLGDQRHGSRVLEGIHQPDEPLVVQLVHDIHLVVHARPQIPRSAHGFHHVGSSAGSFHAVAADALRPASNLVAHVVEIVEDCGCAGFDVPSAPVRHIRVLILVLLDVDHGRGRDASGRIAGHHRVEGFVLADDVVDGQHVRVGQDVLHPHATGRRQRQPVLVPLDFGFRIAVYAAFQAAGSPREEDALFRALDEARVLGDGQLESLARLAVLVGGHGFVDAHVAIQHPVDEERQLTVARVRERVAPAHVHRFVVEEELHCRFGVAVHVPISYFIDLYSYFWS